MHIEAYNIKKYMNIFKDVYAYIHGPLNRRAKAMAESSFNQVSYEIWVEAILLFSTAP